MKDQLGRYRLAVLAGVLLILILQGCASHSRPLETREGVIPSEVFEYRGRDGSSATRGFHEQLTASEKAVRQAGVRMGATAGYKHEAERLFEKIKPYGEQFNRIFSFNDLLLPESLLPPVITLTERQVRYQRNEREESARVLRTTSDARFVGSAPSWEDYLYLHAPSIERPSPRLADLIDQHRSVYRAGVAEGWVEGVESAREAMEISINELQSDYMGMQLFRYLWLSGMIEPPQIVTAEDAVQGGGPESREMHVGVRRTVLTQPAYLVPDTQKWRALSLGPWEDQQKIGLSDLVPLHQPSVPGDL